MAGLKHYICIVLTTKTCIMNTKSFFTIALFSVIVVASANVTNDGATITILSGTTVTVLGNVENKVGSTIANNGEIEVVNGDFTNAGTQAIGGLVKFLGDDGAIVGTSNFKDVEVNCTNGITVEAGLNTFNENLFIKKGNITSFVAGGNIAYGADANLVYNGSASTIPGLEFPPHQANYNPKKVIIDNAAGVNMASLSNSRQVLGTLVMKSGNLTSNGKLILASTPTQTAIVDDFSEGNASSTIIGSMTVERHVQNPPVVAFPGNHQHFIGSPLTGSTVSGWADDFDISAFNGATNGTPVIPKSNCDPTALASGSPYGRVYSYDESLTTFCYLQGWRVRTGTHNISRGDGFSAVVPTTRVIDQVGNYSNASVAYTNLSNTGGVASVKATHLLSNPFCAPIDWSQNYTLNGGTSSDIDGAAYLYNPDGGVFEVYNNINQGYIGTTQAFQVRAKNTIRSTNNNFSFTLDANSRVTTNNNTFYRRQSNYAFGYEIELTAPNSRWDKTMLVFDDLFTDDFDNGFDADKIMSSPGSPSLYTKMPDGYNLAIQAIPVNTNIITVPLSLKPEGNGNFSLNFNELQNIPGTIMVTLEDTKTNTFQDIRTNTTYNFTASATDNVDRFLIHFTPQLEANVFNASCNVNNDAFIVLNQPGGVEWDYTLVDNNSNIVANATFTGLDTINNLTPGTYTLNLLHSSGYSTSETYTVGGSPIVEALIIASATEVEQNDMITLEAAGTGATNYNWNMGDGTFFNNTATVDHSYMQPGTYQVVLVADNGICSDEQTIQIVVNETVITNIINAEAGKLLAYHHADKLYFKQTLYTEGAGLSATLYNTLGQVVLTVNGQYLSYNQVFVAPVNNLASGTYVLQVKTGDKTAIRKIIISE